ncbi:FAD-binding domain [Legionella cincinnatiensis]|uniref:Oxidoreductase n=1 Tax=Legionella cincinnatiensis TaxID=28085 RepID=A0A378IHA9_9GAMM|nr:FAD-binding domain [Legionella cincinnatiensis]KTC82711.1 oxidoreductase [Legionella cincinnatiensis]STX34142.1 oxidoreductase [Legionella cincinnatiensis]
MRILISGAGIAGPTLAYWLLQYGFEPTLIEQAPQLRTGGYIIDFWGAGFDIAERMRLVPEIKQKGYDVKEVRIVGSSGKRIGGFPVKVFNQITQGRYISIARGDLAKLIFNKLDGKVETIFDDRIKHIEQTENAVHVNFERGNPRQFDLVIGADGLHSKVRELVFGPQSQFEKYLGYKVAAFEVDGYRPRDELVYVMYKQVGQQVGRFAKRDDRTMFLFIFTDEQFSNLSEHDLTEQKAQLKNRFCDSGWECAQILRVLDTCDELYFDRVSQICMNKNEGLWTKGRVTLIGDAASCISLLGGQGAALAMVAAYILAGELYQAQGNYQLAFSRYQDLFEPFVKRKQEAALKFAGVFAPKSSLSLFVSNKMMSAMSIPWIAKMIARRDLMDNIKLPEYNN